MPKLTEYPEAQSFDENDILIKDGVNGTKKIKVSKAADYMGKNVIMVNEDPTPGTKVVLETTDEEYSLALMSDVDSVAEEVTDLKTHFNKAFTSEFSVNDIATFSGVTKLANFSFAPSENYASGTENNDYDSYYFYTNDDAAIYFASASITTPSYCAITIGKNPSKEWVSYGGGNNIGMICDSVDRYRNINNNLPVESYPLDVSESIVIFTVTKDLSAEFYYNNLLGLNDDVTIPLLQSTGTNTQKAMSQKAVTDAISTALGEVANVYKKKYIQYHTANNGYYSEYLCVYMPTNRGHIRYDIMHNENVSQNSDIWRIDNAYVCDDYLTNDIQITSNGEWELAIHLKDRNDFSGGIMHGDEILDSVVFFLDGVVTDITRLTELTEFREFSFAQTSNLYDPNDGTTLIAVHGSEHIFSNNVIINQSLIWKVAEQLTSCYMAMFPITKTYSNKLFTDANFIVTDLTGAMQTISDVRKARIYSTIKGLYARFDTPEYPTEYGNDSFVVYDNTLDQSGVYNKCYYNITQSDGSTSSEVNELWKSQSIYDIQI